MITSHDNGQEIISLMKLMMQRTIEESQEKKELAHQILALFEEYDKQRSHDAQVIKKLQADGQMARAGEAALRKLAEAESAKREEAEINKRRWRQGYEIALEEKEEAEQRLAEQTAEMRTMLLDKGELERQNQILRWRISDLELDNDALRSGACPICRNDLICPRCRSTM